MLFALFLFSLQSFAQPIFQNVGTDQTIACGTALPDLGGVTATSACSGPVSVSSFVYESGNIINQCNVTTALGPGIDWAVWLPTLDAPSVAWHFTGDQELTFYANGTGRLTGTIRNSVNADWEMSVDMRFENGRDWDQWAALGRGYKDDLNLAAENYLNWTYYELNPTFSHLTGIGVLEGSDLHLAHLPTNYYFGFQVGVGSNNKNANDGMSGWFSFSGTFNGEEVSGNGDVNVDRSCESNEQTCGSTVFTAEYRAEDSCGNVAFESRVITVTDTDAPVIDAVQSPIFVNCALQDSVFITATDACSDITINYSDVVEEEGCPGLITRNYTVTDGCNNASTASQQIFLVEEGSPEFTLFPADTTLNCADVSGLNPVVEFTQVCFNTVLTQTEEVQQGNCPSNYTLIRTYTLTDACGNTVSQAWTVTVSDNNPPIFTGVPDDLELVCGTESETLEPTASDDCSEFTITSSQQTNPLACAFEIVTTWTATDACGNSAEAQQTVTYTDDVDPVFSFIPESVTLNCGEPFVLDTAEVADGCSEVTLAWTDESLFDCAGSYIRIWRAFDGCGNQALESTVVTFVDNEDPVLVGIPESNGGSCGSPEFDVNVSAIDNCDDEPEVTVEVSSIPGNCGSIATYTWTATDACGNSVSETRTYNLTDDLGPVFDNSNDTVFATCGDPSSLLDLPALAATDACSEVTLVTFSDQEVPADCGGIIVRTYTATDGCGNTGSANQIIVLSDNVPPVFISTPNNLVSSCGGTDNEELPVVEDNCSEVSITFNDEPLSGQGCTGSLLRTWIAADACGNTATQEQIISFSDDAPPVIVSAPEDFTASCDDIPAVDINAIVFEDNCSNATVSVEESQVPGFCPGGFNIERIWTVSDACGNSTSVLQTIFVVDETAPVLSGIPADTTILCGSELPIATIAATDNCTPVDQITFSVEEQIIPGLCGNLLLRIYSASDACGNTTNAVQEILLADEANPVFVFVPEAVTITCGDESGLLDAVATDDCSELEISEQRIATGDCANSFIRQFTATDGCGNTATAQQVVTVIDNEGPSFEGVPATIEIGCNDITPAADVVALDACGTVTMSHEDVSQFLPCGGLIIRTYTAQDACGNSTSFTQSILIEDNEGPVFENVPADVNLACGTDVPPVQLPGAFDECSQAVEVTFEEFTEVGFCAGSFSISRVFTATDLCGNSSTVTQTIFFNDNVPPVFDEFAAEVVVACSEVDQISVTATDNCGSAQITFEDVFVPGSCGLRTRTYTAVDACGNIAQATQTISASDFTDPVFLSFPVDAAVSCSEVVPVNDVEFAFEDNCTDVEVEWIEDIVEGDCPYSYTSIRTCTITDGCGNSATNSYTLEVSDTEGPQIIGAPEDLTLPCGTEVPVSDVTAIDNCTAAPVFTLSETMEMIGCNSIITRRWTAEDECGNVTQSVQIITFIDESLPEFDQLPDDIILTCGDEVPAAPVLTAFDACSGSAEVTFTENTNGTNDCGTIERTWCATDCSGNEACHVQLIVFEQPQQSPLVNNPELRAWQQSANDMMIEFTAHTEGRWNVDVFDLNGRKVTNAFAGDLKAGENRVIQFDIEAFVSGVYMIRFSNGDTGSMQRIPILR